MSRILLLLVSSLALAAAALAQRESGYDSSEDTRAALVLALAEAKAAQERSLRYDQEAQQAQSAAEKSARETAAIAARIQQAEAGIAAANARIAMIDEERRELRERIGSQQRPVVRLTAALQQFTRRPVALALLRPGSVKDLVYLRAMLHDAVPQVRARTQGLRDQVARGRELRREASAASLVLRSEEAALGERRSQLADRESEQRLAARAAGSEASREADRALVLAEEARDLDALVGELDQAARLRSELAALAGPQLRSASPQLAASTQTLPAPSASSAATTGNLGAYILPVGGRTVTGFRAPLGSGLSNGLVIAPIGGAQLVAPAAGRVAFAGPYRGYGQIVIIEHASGWTSLITGLARADVEVGAQLEGGSPIGVAGPDRPTITVELRRNGAPVNPLLYTD